MRFTTQDIQPVAPDCTPAQLRYVAGIMNGTVDPARHPAGVELARQCYGNPSASHMAMHVIDAMIGTHGLENMDDGAVGYCNAGDPYIPTVCYSSWGGFTIAAEGDMRRDIEHCRETVRELNHPEEVCCDGCLDGVCDCYAGETVMLSTGYAEVFRGGEVVQHGQVIHRVE